MAAANYIPVSALLRGFQPVSTIATYSLAGFRQQITAVRGNLEKFHALVILLTPGSPQATELDEAIRRADVETEGAIEALETLLAMASAPLPLDRFAEMIAVANSLYHATCSAVSYLLSLIDGAVADEFDALLRVGNA